MKKAIVILIAAMSAISIPALPTVPTSLPPAMCADMEVMTNIGLPAESAP